MTCFHRIDQLICTTKHTNSLLKWTWIHSQKAEELTGYGWTTVNSMDSLQLLQDIKNILNEKVILIKNNTVVNGNAKIFEIVAEGPMCPSDATSSPALSLQCRVFYCRDWAHSRPQELWRSGHMGTFPVLMYCLQTAAQVIRGPNAHRQPFSCVKDINLMRRVKKH